jgi:hypothetical protein
MRRHYHQSPAVSAHVFTIGAARISVRPLIGSFARQRRMAFSGHALESPHGMAGDDAKHPILYTLLGLNTAGKFLHGIGLLFVVAAGVVWVVFLPQWRFTDKEEALFRAARHGDRAGVERALADGARIDAESPMDRKTALFRAAVFGYDDVVRYLLERGASPAARGADGRTALEVVQAAREDEKSPDAAKGLDAVIAVLRDTRGAR